MWQHIRNRPEPKPRQKVIFRVVMCALSIPPIVMGVTYLHDCPRQPYIPIYLVVSGVVSLISGLFSFLSLLPCTKKPEDGSTSIPYRLNLACKIVLGLFLFCWFITGNVWVYTIYQPNYDQTTTTVDPYCAKSVYMFAFWSITSSYILLGVFLIVVGCSAIRHFTQDKNDPVDQV